MKLLFLFLISTSAFACERSMRLEDVQDLIADKTIRRSIILSCKLPEQCICADGWEDGAIRAFGKLRAGQLEADTQKKVIYDGKVADKEAAVKGKEDAREALIQKIRNNTADDKDYQQAVKMLLGL